MIERLLLALIIIAVIGAAGYALRWWAAWRRRRNGAWRLEPSPSALPRLIAFSSPGCVSCRAQRRIIDATLAEWEGDVDISYVDAVAEPELARRLGIVVVPTTVVAAADGHVVGITGGVADVDHLLRQLSQAAA